MYCFCTGYTAAGRGGDGGAGQVIIYTW
jgi:hypothetical protein